MKLFPAIASASVLLISGVAFGQDQPTTPPPPAQPAAPPAPAPTPPAADQAQPTTTQAAPTYGKGWNAKKCADAKTKGKKIPDGACPDEMAPK
jgi:hypothetical protein